LRRGTRWSYKQCKSNQVSMASKETPHTSWRCNGIQVEIADKLSEKEAWRYIYIETILETTRCDVRRGAVTSYYRSKECAPVVILTNRHSTDQLDPFSKITHKLGQRKLRSRRCALVKLERYVECTVYVRSQERRPVIGIWSYVAQ